MGRLSKRVAKFLDSKRAIYGWGIDVFLINQSAQLVVNIEPLFDRRQSFQLAKNIVYIGITYHMPPKYFRIVLLFLDFSLQIFDTNAFSDIIFK